MKEPEFLHFHNCFEIGRCLNGCGSVCFKNYRLPYEADQFTVISPLEPHISICTDEPSQWEYIFFDPTILFGISNPSTAVLYQNFYLFQEPSRRISASEQPFLHQILSTLYDEFHARQSFYPDAIHSLLIILLAELKRLPASRHPVIDSVTAPVRTALLYIYSHYTEPVSVSELAALCCLSESHFRRIFKQMIGISPLEYLQHYRIQHACHLILQNREPLNRIAEQVGYQTLSSFNRQFQQYTGLSPSVWKKEYMAIPVCHDVTSLEDSRSSGIFRY